ncbi:interleukin 17-like protein [Octopus bimaculoides]|uniref:Interleukin 17-like protein n=1 Tax=Octopus bimaculoides TaxID=37653 RepID=A0A0L8GIP0_OCTBM|nr:interleukin 17-like protein [Octopus bimaculoides]|eukprot:XP_014781029.1 PREDICTED: interleukin 17-like protein [Octopus bimaculoides]
MKITKVSIHVVLFHFFCFISIVPSASIPVQCKIPTNLKILYENIANIPAVGSDQVAVTDEDKTCPTALLSTVIRERSTCPWYLKMVYDSLVYPPLRTEAVCRCRNCLDSDNNHQCVTVYTKMTVLKRTGECVDGQYVYKPSVIEIATACVCARKIDVQSDSINYVT